MRSVGGGTERDMSPTKYSHQKYLTEIESGRNDFANPDWDILQNNWGEKSMS